jgi:hypothetical protein
MRKFASATLGAILKHQEDVHQVRTKKLGELVTAASGNGAPSES